MGKLRSGGWVRNLVRVFEDEQIRKTYTLSWSDLHRIRKSDFFARNIATRYDWYKFYMGEKSTEKLLTL